MEGSRQDGHLPECEMHNMQQRNGAKADTRANPLLRRARKARTWSQAELAEHIGVAKETIS